jgi:hypothetical protein
MDMRKLKREVVVGCMAFVAMTGCGEAGTAGSDGQPGLNGVDGANGADGVQGSPGMDGSSGVAGFSCSASESDSGGKIIRCSDGTSVTLASERDEEPARSAGRLVFGDAEAEGVRVLDLATGQIVGTASGILPGANLYTTESGRIVAAVQGAAHRVDFIDSGLRVEQRGEIRVETEGQVRKLAFAMVGEQLGALTPIHFVAHHGYVAVHFDGRFDGAVPANNVSAKSVVLKEGEILGNGEITLEITTDPQHGVSFVTEEGKLLSSAPSSDRSVSTAPNGFLVYGLDGTLEQTIQDGADFEASCWGLHGEVAVGQQYLFGCHESLGGGVAVLSWSEANGRYESRKIKYPGYPAATKRTSVLTAHPKSLYAVGQWGRYGAAGSEYTGLVRIDPNASEITSSDILELGAVYCSYGFEQGEGETVVALARDGRVHSIDVPSWSGHKTAQLLSPSDTACEGRLVVGEGAAYITRAATGDILEIDIRTLEVTRTFHVGGKPGSATLAGFWAPVDG